jgi:hypothetical protein
MNFRLDTDTGKVRQMIADITDNDKVAQRATIYNDKHSGTPTRRIKIESVYPRMTARRLGPNALVDRRPEFDAAITKTFGNRLIYHTVNTHGDMLIWLTEPGDNGRQYRVCYTEIPPRHPERGYSYGVTGWTTITRW